MPEIKIIENLNENQIIYKIFDDKLLESIDSKANSKTKYLIISYGSDVDMDFNSGGDYSDIEIYGVFFSKNSQKIRANISINLKNDNSTANVYLISFMENNAIVDVKGNIDISKGVKLVAGHLIQENIVLAKNIKVDSSPILKVSSNDVSASHGAKIQRLDDNKMFYMMSKGLSDKNSKELIVRGYVDYILAKFDILDDDKILIEKQILDYLF